MSDAPVSAVYSHALHGWIVCSGKAMVAGPFPDRDTATGAARRYLESGHASGDPEQAEASPESATRDAPQGRRDRRRVPVVS